MANSEHLYGSVSLPETHTEFWGGIQTPITAAIQQANVANDYPPTFKELEKEFPQQPNSWEITSEEIEAWATHTLQTTAIKYDDNKTDWSLVPFESLEGMVRVLEFGAKKYDNWNWTNDGGFPYTRVLRSCLRHIFSYMRGEDNDPESGLSHIHHAMCNLLFISHYIGNKEKFNKDDRHVR